MADNEQATAADNALDAAAAEAVADESDVAQTDNSETETTGQEKLAAESEQSDQEQEQLPDDHNERSKLGRKLSAYHRRVDEIDNRFDRIETMLSSITQKEEPQDDSYADDEPLTRKELDAYYASMKKKEASENEQYDKIYAQTMYSQGPDLEQAEFDAVMKELETIRYDKSQDPKRDAEMNFLRGERAYLRKLSAAKKKDIPLKGDKAPGAGLKEQKIETKETQMPKLDGVAKSYLDFVARKDGEEKATKLAKSVNG